ncbi:MAG TPA: PilZ domain-containing protein [Thermoanaerobaculia bacterium]|nr:PilZ domain-containing protein [Thermoanaerobaculia bacterium]
MHEAAARTLRTAERYLLQPPLAAQFDGAPVSVCDISAKGARFTHGHSLQMGQKALLRLPLDGRPAPLQLEAVVVWTQIDPISPSRFVSGVRTYGAPEVMEGMLEHLRKSKRTTRIEELRGGDRFAMQQPLAGTFGGAPVTIENLSVRGARIVTAATLAPARQAAFSFLNVEVIAQVAWCAIKSLDPTTYRAGLAIAEKAELMRLAIGQLCESGHAILDTQSLALKLKIIRARARQLAPSFRIVESAGVPAEQYLLIQGVREELRLNPEEAMHWYRRARLTINDPATRRAAPSIADHPDALAVWEYLDRSIDPSLIGRTFNLPSN